MMCYDTMNHTSAIATPKINFYHPDMGILGRKTLIYTDRYYSERYERMWHVTPMAMAIMRALSQRGWRM